MGRQGGAGPRESDGEHPYTSARLEVCCGPMLHPLQLTVVHVFPLQMIKTRCDLVSALTSYIQKEHPYDVPEVISVPVSLC